MDPQRAEQHRADDRDAQGGADPLRGTEHAARRRPRSCRVPTRGDEVLVGRDRHAVAQPGHESGATRSHGDTGCEVRPSLFN